MVMVNYYNSRDKHGKAKGRQTLVMSDLAYLQDAQWLAKREKQWRIEAARLGDDLSDQEFEARRHYFMTGDIDHYIENTDWDQISIVIGYAPFNKAEKLIHNISRYWHWVLEYPETQGGETHKPLEYRFNLGIMELFNYSTNYMSAELCRELFNWLYGDTYEPKRMLTLDDGTKQSTYQFTIDPADIAQKLLSGIIKYLWHRDRVNGVHVDMYRGLIPYFLSAFTHMPALYFGTDLPQKFEFTDKDGNRHFRKYWIWNRWLLTGLNGYITEFEEEEDITELVCHDQQALEELTQGLAKLDLPEEYYQLEEFVHKHKGESIDASE